MVECVKNIVCKAISRTLLLRLRMGQGLLEDNCHLILFFLSFFGIFSSLCTSDLNHIYFVLSLKSICEVFSTNDNYVLRSDCVT